MGKPHYIILDALRGVAALFVIIYHFGEAFATSPVDQQFNHGYLAVDFFFVLSGFVLGYAYDARWRSGAMTAGKFILRRIVRLQPMVVAGVLLGVLAFFIQGCEKWDHTPVSVGAVIACALLGLLCIPAIPGTAPEIRGNGEMFPLNGPSWSLFFEYIGSILYALFLHRLSTPKLRIYTALSALGLALWALCDMSGAYHLGVGWSLLDFGLIGGFLRLSFSFSIGLLMSREFHPMKIRGAFWICSLIIFVCLAMPYVTTTGEKSILNGIYDLVCTLVVFPTVVYMGASENGSEGSGICEFLGNISYPVYIIHYPAMYLFYSWVWNNGITFEQAIPVMCCILVGAVIAASLFSRFYDRPVRRWLGSKL